MQKMPKYTVGLLSGRGLREKMKRAGLGLLLIVLVLAGWMREVSSPSRNFVYGGGVLGVGTGAIIGAAAGNVAAGAAVGGPVGLVAGYFIGESLRKALESKETKRGGNGTPSRVKTG
jgi:hypothetical protein